VLTGEQVGPTKRLRHIYAVAMLILDNWHKGGIRLNSRMQDVDLDNLLIQVQTARATSSAAFHVRFPCGETSTATSGTLHAPAEQVVFSTAARRSQTYRTGSVRLGAPREDRRPDAGSSRSSTEIRLQPCFCRSAIVASWTIKSSANRSSFSIWDVLTPSA